MKRKVPLIAGLVLMAAVVLAMPSSILPGQSAINLLGWSMKHPWKPFLPALKLQTNEADFRTIPSQGSPSLELAVWVQTGKIMMESLYYRHSDREIAFTSRYPEAMDAIQQTFGSAIVNDFEAAEAVFHQATMPPTTLYRGQRYGYEVSYYPDSVRSGYIANFTIVPATVVDCSVSSLQAGSRRAGIDMSCFSAVN